MKTIEEQATQQELRNRLRKITPESRRRWGAMTPNQMVCHLNDSFKVAMGEKTVGPRTTILSRTVVKWIALHAPLPWPKGIKTMPEVDQKISGTKPVEFERDLQDLQQTLERFVSATRDYEWCAHPMFGTMTEADWLRWGYLHMDHHLRQFGA